MTTRGENGWQSEKTLTEGIQYMLDNKVATDVCIEVGPPDGATVTFRAHKFILITRSEVFEGMFSSGMAECKTDPEPKIRIEDIDADVFKEVLNYMYCESASVCPDSAVQLMYAAKKYMLSKLVGECSKCLLDNVDINNVIHFLDVSLHFDEQQLQSACLELISLNAKAVLTGTEILSASRLVMEAILEAKTIPLRESVIYETAIKWAKHQLQRVNPEEDPPTNLQIRETLGDLLYKIRFPVMKPTEFAEISAGNDVLTLEEKDSIYYFLVTKKTSCQLKFPTTRRTSEDIWVDRPGLCKAYAWRSTRKADAINFKTDQDILLTGVGLYTGHKERGYDVDVEILQATNSLAKKSVSVPYTGNSTPYKILFDEPIVIVAGVVYSVKALSYDRIGYYCFWCGAVRTKEEVTFTFTKNLESLHTTECRGQIPRLYFGLL